MPAITPVSIPLFEPIVATLVALLVQLPPAGVVDKVVEVPVQAGNVAEKLTGVGFTVNSAID